MCSSHFKWAFCIKCVAVKLFSVPVQKSNKVKEQLKDLTRDLLWVETQLGPQRRLIVEVVNLGWEDQEQWGCRNIHDKEIAWTMTKQGSLTSHLFYTFNENLKSCSNTTLTLKLIILFTRMTHNQKWTFPTTTLNSPSELQCMSLPLLLEHKLTQATHGTRDLFCSC